MVSAQRTVPGDSIVYRLAVDLGANGGKVYAGRIEPDTVDLTEITRFDNRPIERDGRYVWDVPTLLDSITDGIETACNRYDVGSVAIDTWGLDFGLLADGELLRAPYSYRDPTLLSTRDDAVSSVDRRTIFEATGIDNWNTPNTLWQYHYLATREPELLERADQLLMMPQLLTFLLGGDPVGEATIASTTQMLDTETRTWATDLLDRLDLPTDVLPAIREPGTRVGTVAPEHLPEGTNPPALVLPGSHDTAAAVAGLPLTDEESAFLSTGTWFLAGFERAAVDRSDAAFDSGASNELGVEGTVRFLRNVNGFFLLEECREAWKDVPDAVTDYDELLRRAKNAPAFGSLVDPDDERFGIEGSMPESIREHCRETGQAVPETQGELVRCLVDSLSIKASHTLTDLADVLGESFERIHVGGGGVRNELFCQSLATASGRVVVAGPTEATAVGNVLTQAVAFDDIADLATGRRLVEELVDVRTYEPEYDERLDDARKRMRALIER